MLQRVDRFDKTTNMALRERYYHLKIEDKGSQNDIIWSNIVSLMRSASSTSSLIRIALLYVYSGV
jgi:hypothetical protein